MACIVSARYAAAPACFPTRARLYPARQICRVTMQGSSGSGIIKLKPSGKSAPGEEATLSGAPVRLQVLQDAIYLPFSQPARVREFGPLLIRAHHLMVFQDYRLHWAAGQKCPGFERQQKSTIRCRTLYTSTKPSVESSILIRGLSPYSTFTFFRASCTTCLNR